MLIPLTFLATTLALPSKLEQKVLVASRNLYHSKQALEINKYAKQSPKNKNVCKASTSMKPRDWLFLFVDFTLYGILPEVPKEAPPLNEEQIGSFIMQSPSSHVKDLMTGYCFFAHLKKKHRLHYKKSIMACVALPNLLLSFGIAYREWVITS